MNLRNADNAQIARPVFREFPDFAIDSMSGALFDNHWVWRPVGRSLATTWPSGCLLFFHLLLPSRGSDGFSIPRHPGIGRCDFGRQINPPDSRVPGFKNCAMPRADRVLEKILPGDETCRCSSGMEIARMGRWLDKVEPGHRVVTDPEFDGLLYMNRRPVQFFLQFTAEAFFRRLVRFAASAEAGQQTTCMAGRQRAVFEPDGLVGGEENRTGVVGPEAAAIVHGYQAREWSGRGLPPDWSGAGKSGQEASAQVCCWKRSPT